MDSFSPLLPLPAQSGGTQPGGKPHPCGNLVGGLKIGLPTINNHIVHSVGTLGFQSIELGRFRMPAQSIFGSGSLVAWRSSLLASAFAPCTSPQLSKASSAASRWFVVCRLWWRCSSPRFGPRPLHFSSVKQGFVGGFLPPLFGFGVRLWL